MQKTLFLELTHHKAPLIFLCKKLNIKVNMYICMLIGIYINTYNIMHYPWANHYPCTFHLAQLIIWL